MFERRELPRRPTIPVVLHVLGALMVADRAMLAGGKPWLEGSAGKALALVVGAVLACGALIAVRNRGRANALLPVGLALVVSLAQTSLVLRGGERLVTAMSRTAVSSCELVIRTEPVSREDTWRCRAALRTRDGLAGDVWLALLDYERCGSTLACVGRFAPNADDAWGRTSRMQGVWGTVSVVRVLESRPREGPLAWIDEVRRMILERIDPTSSEERALLAGCLCGSRTGLVAFGLDKAFSRCGISHLVAVSGGHMAVIASMLTAVLLAIGLSPVPRGVSNVCVCGLFVLLCGAPVSAVRSWAMSCMAMAGGWAGRRSHGLSGVCVVGLVLALLDPTLCGQMGFALSVCSVVGLCLFSPYASYVLVTLFHADVSPPRWVPRPLVRTWRKVRPALRDAVAASIVAQLATMPVSAEAFGEVSLVGPVANVLVCLPFSALMTTGVASAALCPLPGVQRVALGLCDLLAHTMLVTVGWLGSLPGASVDLGDGAVVAEVACCLLAVAVLALWPSVRRAVVFGAALACATVACVYLAYWRLFAPARICVLDVGQGDAVLVQDGAAAVLVDAGPDDAVVRALMRNHVMHLDAVIVTHLHADHYAGMEALAGKVACDRVVVADGVSKALPESVRNSIRALTGSDATEVRCGDRLDVGHFSMRVVWPVEEVDGSQNEHSIELVATYDDRERSLVALLTGDAEREQTAAALRRGSIPNVDVLKVGHHGSAVSVDEWVADKLDAEVAVASAGKNNSYGHPSAECVRTLVESGSLFLCTMDVGDVTLLPAQGGVAVLCQRPAA